MSVPQTSLFGRTAVLSPCGRYRYRLDDPVDGGPRGRVVWVMLNPSKADAETDDPPATCRPQPLESIT